MKYIFAALLIGLCSASAQTVDPHSIAPPQILQMDSLPNAGALLLKFCAIGSHICVERSTSCHGQCCSQWNADAEGYGCSGDVYGFIPPGFHYAGWRCEMYSTPGTDASHVTEGAAGPEPEYIKQCTNFRHRF